MKNPREWHSGSPLPINEAPFACNCIGPQDGKPLCPCRMRGVTIKDGRYVEEIDHGPVSKADDGFMTRWAKEMRDAL